LFLAVNAKGGELVGQTQKERATTPFSKSVSQRGIIQVTKKLLTPKGRTSSGGAFI
jgi:hypothetical protein